jgi:hypothetical protein
MLFNRLNRGFLFEEATGGEGGGGGAAGGTPPVVDAAAVQKIVDTAINGYAAKTNKTLDGFKTQFEGLMGRLDSFKVTPPVVVPPLDGDGTAPVISPAVKAILDKADRDRTASEARIALLEKTGKDSEARAETTDRESKVRAALGKIRFATPEDNETVYDVVASKVKRDEDGNLIVGDTTMEAFLTAYLDKRPRMLAAENVGGSGNGSGSGRAGKVLLEAELKTPQQRKDYLAEIQRVAASK